MYHLAAITRYLEDVRDACAADARLLAGDASLSAELGAISSAASRMLSEFVLRFGVIGDSNSGKSRLIGGLIGKVDALDSSGMPWTGNISILRVRSDAKLQATSIGPFELRFMTKKAAYECMCHLLDAFVAELDGLEGGGEFAATGRELRGQLQENVLAPDGLFDWLDATWRRMSAQSVNVYLRLTELGRFATTWQYLGAAVAGKRCLDVQPDVARAATRLPKEIRAESFGDFAKALKKKIAQVTGGGSLAALPIQPSTEFAEVAYPLVHDIHIEARVPTSVWDLSELRVDAIELFDFPGLAAQGTASRDAFLSLRERRAQRIHTWIIVVNSAELKGSQATEIVKQLPPDRIVAVANRFDALPIWTDGHIEELDRMVEPGAPPRREADVLDRLELLTPLATNIFEKLTRPDRCAFVSAMLGLADLDETGAAPHRVLTDNERRNWPMEIARSRAVQPKWGLLAQKIQAVEGGSRLASWLTAYADPAGQAGLKRLRRILFEHANAVGLVQLTQEMNLRLADLDDPIQAFLVRANRQVEESQAKANALRAQLDQLLHVYGENGAPPASVEDIQVRPNGPLANGNLPPHIPILAPTEKQPAPLLQIIHDETLMRLWEWREWTALLDAGRADGFIDGTTASARPANDDEAPWESADASHAPLRAGEMHDAFRKAYCEVEAIAAAALRSALADFLAGLGSRLIPLADGLATLAQTSPKNVINFALKPQQPATASRFFKEVVGIAPADAPTSVFWRDRYPYLVHADERGQLTPGPFFGWARERRRAVRNKTEHQIYVFRLRTELTNAIEHGVARQIAAGLLSFRNRYNEMRETLTRVVDQLKNQSNANLLALFGNAAAPSEVRHPTLALANVRIRDTAPNA